LIVPIATPILRLWSARVDLTRWTFRTAMLWIGVGVILPMELVDVWLAHGGGNNAKLRATGGVEPLDGRSRAPDRRPPPIAEGSSPISGQKPPA
jgi:hypothetical protein